MTGTVDHMQHRRPSVTSGPHLDSITGVHELAEGEEDMQRTYTSSFLAGTGMERERWVCRGGEVPGPREQEEYLEQALALRADSLPGPLLMDQV